MIKKRLHLEGDSASSEATASKCDPYAPHRARLRLVFDDVEHEHGASGAAELLEAELASIASRFPSELVAADIIGRLLSHLGSPSGGRSR